MTKSLPLSLLLLGLLTVGLAGCKQTQANFVNTTNEAVDLQVHGPGLNVGYLGSIPPHGELATHIKVSPIWLPNTYTWTAGEHSGAFTITSDSRPTMTIAIPQDAQPELAPWRHAQGDERVGSPTPIVYDR